MAQINIKFGKLVLEFAITENMSVKEANQIKPRTPPPRRDGWPVQGRVLDDFELVSAYKLSDYHGGVVSE